MSPMAWAAAGDGGRRKQSFHENVTMVGLAGIVPREVGFLFQLVMGLLAAPSRPDDGGQGPNPA